MVKELIKVEKFNENEYIIYKQIYDEINHYVDKERIKNYQMPFIINIERNKHIINYIQGLHESGKFDNYIQEKNIEFKNTKCKFKVQGYELKASLVALLKQKDYSKLPIFNEYKENIISYWLNHDPFEYDKFRDIIPDRKYEVEMLDNDNKRVRKTIHTIKKQGNIIIKIDNEKFYRNRFKPASFKFYRVAGTQEINHYNYFVSELENFYAQIKNNNLSWNEHLDNEVDRLLSIDPIILEQTLKNGVK